MSATTSVTSMINIEFSWTAPVALRAPSAAQENSILIIDVTDVMALLGVTDVVALEN